MSAEFRVWLDYDGSEDDAYVAMGVCDAEMAANEFVRDFAYRRAVDGNSDLIDGDPVIVHVRAENGARSKFEVSVRATIEATAREVTP